MKNICFVCGYDNLPEPPYNSYGGPSYEICSCCAFQYGLDDYDYEDKKTVFAEWRKNWIKQGYPWFSSDPKPPYNWNPSKQLENIKEMP